MLTLLRILISFALLGLPVVLIVSCIRKEPRLVARSVVLAAALVGIVAFHWSKFLAMRLADYPTGNILKSVIVQMDVDRVVRSVTEHWSGEGSRTTVHPLKPLLFQPIAYIVSTIYPELSNLRTAQITSAIFLSMSASLLFIAAYYYSKIIILALIIVAGYLLSFGYILLSTFPESSGLAAYGVCLPYVIHALYRGKPIGRKELALHFFAGILTLAVTTTNLIHAVIAYTVRVWSTTERRGLLLLTRLALYVFSVAFAAAVLSVLQRKVLYLGADYWFFPSSVAAETRWMAIWWDGMLHPLRTLTQMVVYTVIGVQLRFTELGCRIEGFPMLQLSAETVQFPNIPVWRLGIMLSFLILAMSLGWGKTQIANRVPLLLGLGFNILLHLFYGNELLLYSGNWLPVLWLLFATANYSRLLLFGLSLIVLLIGYNNRVALKEMYQQMNTASNLISLQIPVGLPLQHEFHRTYVDWSGNFSPGIGGSGLLLTVFDDNTKENNLSSIAEHRATYSLLSGYSVPTIRSKAGNVVVEQAWYPLKTGTLVCLRMGNTNGREDTVARVYLLVGRVGPAASRYQHKYLWDVNGQSVRSDGRTVVRCATPPDFVLYHDDYRVLFNVALAGERGAQGEEASTNVSPANYSDGAANLLLGWEVGIRRGNETTLWFHCPYDLPALDRKGLPLHQLAQLEPPAKIEASSSPLTEAEATSMARESIHFLSNLYRDTHVALPDKEWQEGLLGAAVHLLQGVQQDGRIPVTPINYGVFVRDAAYMVYALLVTGQSEYAKHAIEYLLKHPWEGRPYPEGDTPGHLLWVMHKYWLFTRDTAWLQSKLPAIRNIAQAILAIRSDGMRAVEVELLGQRRTIPANPRTAVQLQEKAARPTPFRLNYGTMDQGGLLYVNLVSLAGLQSAVDMLSAIAPEEADRLRGVLQEYLQEFSELLETIGHDLGYDQRGYCFATWPAQIHMAIPKVREYFRRTQFIAQEPVSPWKYLDMDHAHNFLVVGERSAGFGVIQRYLDLYTFKTWKLLDEGGPSSPGYWKELSNWRWNPEVAIPHGWSLASLVLLMRDALVHEEGKALVLLAGVPPEWFAAGKELGYSLPTEYGVLKVSMESRGEDILLEVDIPRLPPDGIYIVVPEPGGERRVRLMLGRNIIRRAG